jgi:hypothetical protein
VVCHAWQECVAGRLATFAEQVEQLLGLPPWEPPGGDSGTK